MAVTLTEGDLMQPDGELENSYFPQSDLDTQLPGWLAVASALVEADSSIATAKQNDAAAAWVYYRAYDYIASQLAALPNSASEGDGALTVSISDGRVAEWRLKAQSKLVLFNALHSATSGVGVHFTLAVGRRGL